MGAQFFEHRLKSSSPKKGYDELVREADYIDGHDCYNGSINTTYLGRTVKIATKYSPTADKKAQKWMDDSELPKRECVCLDLGVVEYRLHKNSKKVYNPKRPALKFVVSSVGVPGKEFKTLALARKYAATLVEKGQDYTIRKEYGSSLIEMSNLTTTVHSRKTKGAEEIHQYIFCGWAAC